MCLLALSPLMALSSADAERLSVLSRYGGLEAPPDRALDRITTLATRIFEVPIALVTLVGEDQQVFRSCYGLGIRGTPRDVSFCTHAVEQQALLVVEDAAEDARFRDNPLVTGDPFIRFYAGAPLVSRDGISFGSLCLIDRTPRTLSDEDAATLTDLAEMVVDELELRYEMQARQDAEQEGHARKLRFDKMLEHSSDVISILDAEGTILYESPSVQPLLGYTPEELLGRPALSYVHEDDREMVMQALYACMTTHERQPPVVFRWQHRDGSWVSLEALGTNLFDDPTIGGLLVNSRDVSMNLRYAQEHEARQRAEEMLRLQDSLLTNMTHELRTPLTAILGISEVFAEEADPGRKPLAAALMSASARLQETLSSLLELAQLEGGTLHFDAGLCDLVTEAKAAVARACGAAEEKGLTLQVEHEGRVPAYTDVRAFGRVLDHLISNAVKFTHAGSITVRLYPVEAGVCVDVADTGIGISEGFLPYAFDPFRQESQGLNRSYEGNGVGLALAQRLITRLGGRLSATSERGCGSTFTVYLPTPDWNNLRRLGRPQP